MAGGFPREAISVLCPPWPSRDFMRRVADLLLPGVGTLGKGRKGRSTRPSAPLFAWLERNTTALIIVSGVPPNAPRIPWENARPRSRLIPYLPGPSSADRGSWQSTAAHGRRPHRAATKRHQAEAIPCAICRALANSAESLVRRPIVSSASTRQLTGHGRSCALPQDVSSAGLRTPPAMLAGQPTSL
jgi:hypothetical protein